MSYNLIFLVVNFSSFCTMKNNRLKTEISSDIFLRNALTLVQDSESDSRSDRIQDSPQSIYRSLKIQILLFKKLVMQKNIYYYYLL